MKVTKSAIEQRIKHVRYSLHPGSTTTTAYITLDNGYEQVGTSACVDPAEFRADYGRTLAYEDAFRQLYAPMAFLLLEAQFQQKNSRTFANALKAMKEGKRVTRTGFDSPAELYIKNGVMTVDFIGGTEAGDGMSTENMIAEDWKVL